MLKIYTMGEDVLRKQAATIPDINQSIINLAEAMVETMHLGSGIGLAGPQVGELRRIFVVHVNDDVPRIFINPEIIATSPEQTDFEEGCLSIPEIYSDVIRPSEITVQAWNEKGKPFTLSAGGILARVIQHEYDHLRGVLFLDHLDEKKRSRLIKVYEKKSKI